MVGGGDGHALGTQDRPKILSYPRLKFLGVHRLPRNHHHLPPRPTANPGHEFDLLKLRPALVQRESERPPRTRCPSPPPWAAGTAGRSRTRGCPAGRADESCSRRGYGQAQKVFTKGCAAAGLHDVRVHDLRHTFGVHWVQAGLPLPRLQKILGHATPAMTLRYARHAPEAFFAEDAARIAASLSGTADREAEAIRRAAVRADSA